MGDTTLRELVYGKGAHADPVACIEDVSPELAASRVGGYPHSIWQIVEHMNYWMEHDLARMAGEARAYPGHAIESWPEHPVPADGAAWKSATQRFAGLLARLAQMAGMDDAALSRQVSLLGPGQARRESTVGAMLHQIVAHNSYHAGQIALLRRQAGAWPPERGGDTW